MNKTLLAAVLSVATTIGLASSAAAGAREIRVEITNLTNAIYYTPLLVAAHRPGAHLFELATPASSSLQAMAEGGDIGGLIGEVESVGGTYVADPAGGVLAPGATATATLQVHGRRSSRLSVTAMLLPTNDGFVGLDSLRIPHAAGSYTYFLRGYDAGTEANDEIVNGGGAPGVPGIPADPGGNNGSGASGAGGPDHNGTVHLHRGTLGDHDPSGGLSDLDAGVHRWLNPVARLVITVRKGHHDD